MNRFTEAPRDNFKFGGILNYFTLSLTDNLAMTNCFTLPPFSWAKLSALAMFSKVPRGQIKKVTNFTLWFDIHLIWLSFILTWYLMNWVSFKLRSLKSGGKSFTVGILMRYSEAVVQTIHKIYRKTTVPESLLKQSCRRQVD